MNRDVLTFSSSAHSPSARAVGFISVVSVAVLVSAGCGDGRLTPEQVRTFLDEPTGSVTPDTMSFVTRDLFQADRATSIENFAQVMKVAAAADDGAIIEDGKDVFCAVGLAGEIATFDACVLGTSCKSEFTLDSCLMRLGDEGDEDARGRIKFSLENKVEGTRASSNFSLGFEGWEMSRDDVMLDAIDGIISLEASATADFDFANAELIFVSDVDFRGKRKERGFLDDGIEEEVNLSAALRFKAEQTIDSASGVLEVLAFVDQNGERTQSVAIRLAAESHLVDAESAMAGASLQVIGNNGIFECNWSAAEEIIEREGARVSAAGECIDENGESFTWSGEAIDQ